MNKSNDFKQPFWLFFFGSDNCADGKVPYIMLFFFSISIKIMCRSSLRYQEPILKFKNRNTKLIIN